MNSAIRWRIITLQAVMVVVLAFASGFALYEGAFVTGMVHDQLAQQQIYFPPQSAVTTGGALDPAEFSDIDKYAGQQVDNGEKAQAYANGFIGRHLQKVANGQTYAQVSTAGQALSAQIAATSPSDPNYTKMQAQLATINGQKATLFQGEMLRSTLLNAYGWGTFGTYVTFGGYVLVVATLVILGALVYELFFAAARIGSKAQVTKPVTA